MILLLAFLVLSLCWSAFFSAAETVFISASEDKLYDMAAKENKNAQHTLDLIKDKNKIVATALLASNLGNVLASSLITVITIAFFGEMANGSGAEITTATICATIVVFLFGEILPKTIALNNPELIAVKITSFFKVCMLIASPIIEFTVIFNIIIFRLFGVRSQGKIHLTTHEEIRKVVHIRHEQGKMVKDEKDMLNAVLELSESHVDDIMCHRNDIFAININDAIEEVFAQVSRSKFSRIPFYDGKPDKIIGFLHIRDFFVNLNRSGGDISKVDIKTLLNSPVFVPHKTSLRTQLAGFRKLKTHMVFVVDEYGGLMGLVTFEDLLEEIVGDIFDEHDTDNNDVIECGDGSVLVEGDYPVRDFNKRFGAHFDDQSATTIAGLILNSVERIPYEGENFELHDYAINIYKTDSNKISKLRLQRLSLANQEKDGA